MWGEAFEVTGRTEIVKALGYLNVRETELGGYSTVVVPFYPRDDPSKTINVMLYIATPENRSYMGPADVKAIAKQVIGATGTAGANVEYVTRLADYVREMIPEDDDNHLFTLDYEVRSLLIEDTKKQEYNMEYNDYHDFKSKSKKSGNIHVSKSRPSTNVLFMQYRKYDTRVIN